ncbi:hypothetical protein B0O99DRAFT_673941 [Bisporella sp. PMI_857]|nr:hypothetical protein B0O99DRAFT_673941 [Bisporella sp. PMI_857]
MTEEESTPEINTAADLAQLRGEGRILSSQELEELSTRVKALEDMAKLEDRLKTLESQERPRSTTDSEGNQPKRQRQQREQKGIREWLAFQEWTRENIQNGQNATATLYEQPNRARRLSDQSPVQSNAYLSATERDLLQQDQKASAMTFYSKLYRTLKQQFKTSDIAIPETRAKCVAVAQHVWEGLYNKKENFGSASKYPQTGSGWDRKGQYHLGHRKSELQENDKKKENKKELVYYSCNKPGHHANDCLYKKMFPERPPRSDQLERIVRYCVAIIPGHSSTSRDRHACRGGSCLWSQAYSFTPIFSY